MVRPCLVVYPFAGGEVADGEARRILGDGRANSGTGDVHGKNFEGENRRMTRHTSGPGEEDEGPVETGDFRIVDTRRAMFG